MTLTINVSKEHIINRSLRDIMNRNKLIDELNEVQRKMDNLCNHPFSNDYMEYCKLGNRRLSLKIALGIVR